MRRIGITFLALVSFWSMDLPAHAAGTVALASRSATSASATATDGSGGTILNATGTKAAFASAAPSSDLVAGATDTNGDQDIFIYDAPSGTVRLISHAAGNPTTAANGASFLAGFSRSGRFVLIQSYATDLVGGFIETDTDPDMFVYDTKKKKASLVSHTVASRTTDSAGFAQGGAIAEKTVRRRLYPVVVWETDATDVVADFFDQNTALLRDVYRYDGRTKRNTLVTHDALEPKKGSAACGAFCPVHTNFQLSANGRFLVYGSPAHNLVDGFDDNNGDFADGGDVYLYDSKTNRNTLVSHSNVSPTAGGNGGSDSGIPTASGSHIVYRSVANDLNITGGDGSYDNNTGNRDIFLYNRKAKTTELVSHTPASKTETTTGTAIGASISDDSRYITFQVTKVNEYGSFTDANGTNFNGGRDVIQLDRFTGTLGTFTLVSRSATTAGSGGNGQSAFTLTSSDGRYVAFASVAADLISGFTDNNTTLADLYLWDRRNNAMNLVSRSAANDVSGANGVAGLGSIAAKAPRVGFDSDAGNLIAGFDDNNSTDFDSFVYTLP